MWIDYCEECTALGEDSYLNDDEEWVSACEGCPWEKQNVDEYERKAEDL